MARRIDGETYVRNQAGATMIEYGLIAALVALVVIGAVSLLGTNLQSPFNTLNGTFGNGGEGGGGSPTQATGQSL